MLNVPSSLTQEKLERMLEDEYVLRRRAVELGIPLFTSLEAFEAYIEGIAWMRGHPLTVTALYGSPEPGHARGGAPTARGVVPAEPLAPAGERGGPFVLGPGRFALTGAR